MQKNMSLTHPLCSKNMKTASMTRVMFKTVPFNVPDEEILHLCSFHGKPIDNTVAYDKATKTTRGLPGSTRYVNMTMARGMQFENYYFLEGPLEGDRGARITVLHNNQVPIVFEDKASAEELEME